MESKICTLFSFLCAAKGNWRNSIYVECRGCPYGRSDLCPGFLLVSDYDGQPILISSEIVRNMTGLPADKGECRAVICRQDYEALYALWLEWNVGSSAKCTLLQIASRNNCSGGENSCSCCYEKHIESQCVLSP